jgi:hypothetical protein
MEGNAANNPRRSVRLPDRQAVFLDLLGRNIARADDPAPRCGLAEVGAGPHEAVLDHPFDGFRNRADGSEPSATPASSSARIPRDDRPDRSLFSVRI